ncbi:hypothetical protein, partial [Actinomadura sediminis]
AAWRVGRLRAELPALAAGTAARVDADLAAVPPLPDLTDAELAAALHWTRATLTALHGLEALAGTIAGGGGPGGATAAAHGLAALSRGRARGHDDARIIATAPDVLTLTPPAICPARPLPPTAPSARPEAVRNPGVRPDGSGARAEGGGLPAREELRLRIRWVQELGARVAWTAGVRLAEGGALARAELVRALRLEELVAALYGGALPADLERRPAPPRTAPLPAAFRLAGERIVAEAAPPGDGARPA